MNTTAARRRRQREVGWAPGSYNRAGRFGILRITRGGRRTSYFAQWQPHPLGLTVELTKLARPAAVYYVALPKDGPGLCTHPEHYGEPATDDCKHIAALKAMIAAGRLQA
jgi:hypothetical protein